MTRPLLRSLIGVLILGGAATGTTGCYTACPAIAYLSAVVVDVSAFSDVAAIQFCADAKCSPAPGEGDTASTNLFTATPQDQGTWSLGFDMSTPDVVDIRLFDAQGTLIHESEQAIAWTRTGGACPGPATAEPLTLQP